MISAVAFCPHPPLLVPQLAAGAAGELAGLRDACASAIRRISSGTGQLVLLGSGEWSGCYRAPWRASLAGYGLPGGDHGGVSAGAGPEPDRSPAGADPDRSPAGVLPLSLAVGAWLLGEVLGPRAGALAFCAGPDFAASHAGRDLRTLADRGELTLLVMGDGSARRSVTAPGYLDPRAVAFDDAVLTALRDGDAAALASLDPQLGTELLAAGVAAWRGAGELLGGRSYDAHLLYADDPYGVSYAVAVWTTRG